MKTRHWIVMLSIGILGCWLGTQAVSQPTSRSIPFSAQIEKRLKKSADDPTPEIIRITYARRSDGSFMQMHDARSPDGARTDRMAWIYDATTAKQTTLEPFTKSAITMNYSPREYRSVVGALESENCDATSGQGSGASGASNDRRLERFGRVAKYVVDRWPIATNTDSQLIWTHERYIVPELRCFSFYTIDSRSDGAVVEEEVVDFQDGEPPARYFLIPREYLERSPKQMNDIYSKAFNGKAFWGDNAVSGLERHYQKLRTSSVRVPGKDEAR